jgi:hypothetical protein
VQFINWWLFYIHSSYTILLRCRCLIFLWIYTQSVGLLGRVIGLSQVLYPNTGKHKHRINACARARAHTHTPDIHALSEIRTHDYNVQASKDSSCLRPLGNRDLQLMIHAFQLSYKFAGSVYAVILTATIEWLLFFTRGRKSILIYCN